MKVKVHGDVESFAKRMLYLAWNACGGTFGLGFLQDNPAASEDEVWNNTVNTGDYPFRSAVISNAKKNEVSADYVFGRMMKLYFIMTEDGIEIHNNEWRADYQSFCRTYPNAAALVDAAAKSLGVTVVKLFSTEEQENADKISG
jgi:hypothetical protein